MTQTKEERKQLMQALCVRMINRIEELGVAATTEHGFVSCVDGAYFELPKNHLRCMLKADFKDTAHSLNKRDFREVVDRTLQSLQEVVCEEAQKPFSELIRTVTLQ